MKKNKKSGRAKKPKNKKIVMLLENEEFEKAYNNLTTQPVSSKLDAYRLGLCHLKLGRFMECLCSWLPIIGRLGSLVEEDCRLLVRFLLHNPSIMNHLQDLPLRQLNVFMQALHRFGFESQECDKVRQVLFQKLWDARDFNQLLKLLDNKKEKRTSAWVINCAKSKVHTYGEKDNDVLRFIGTYLTAAANYAIKRSYICGFDEAMNLLGEELYAFLFKRHTCQTLDKIHQEGFQTLIKKEVQIIKSCVSLGAPPHRSCVVTPTYYALQPHEAGTLFVDWMASQAEIKSHAALYTPKGYETFLEGLQLSTEIKQKTGTLLKVKKIGQGQMHAFATLPVDLLMSFFQHFILSNNPAGALAVSTILVTNMSKSLQADLNTTFLNIHQQIQNDKTRMIYLAITAVFPVDIWNEEMLQLLCYHILKQYDHDDPNCQQELQHIEPYIKDLTLRQKIKKVLTRKEEIINFGLSIPKQGVISSVTTEDDLRAMLLDLYALAEWTYPEHALWAGTEETIYNKIVALIFDKRINRLLPLADFFDEILENGYEMCAQDFFYYDIEDALQHFNILDNSLPKIELPKSASSTNKSEYTAIAPDMAPFTTLGLPLNCSKRSVLTHVMQKMKLDPQKMQEHRRAQGKIFDTRWRILNEFYGHLEPEELDAFVIGVEKVELKQLNSISLRH